MPDVLRPVSLVGSFPGLNQPALVLNTRPKQGSCQNSHIRAIAPQQLVTPVLHAQTQLALPLLPWRCPRTRRSIMWSTGQEPPEEEEWKEEDSDLYKPALFTVSQGHETRFKIAQIDKDVERTATLGEPWEQIQASSRLRHLEGRTVPGEGIWSDPTAVVHEKAPPPPAQPHPPKFLPIPPGW